MNLESGKIISFSIISTGKAAHTNTNVTSYGTPSWRYIIDWKTFTYLDRLNPQEKENVCRQFTKRSASADFGMHVEYTRDGSKYHMWKINPADVIDDKLFAAYKESLTYVFSDYVSIKQHENLIFQRPIVVVKGDCINKDGGVGGGSDTFVDDKKKISKKMNNKEVSDEQEDCHKHKKEVKRKSGRKRSKHKKQHIIKRRASLPPITIIKSPPGGDKPHKEEEFPFSIGQMLTTKSCCEVERQKNERQIEKMEKLADSMGQSYDFYLPTLKYGNYVHLFSEKEGRLVTKDRDANKMPNIIKQERT